MTAVAYPLNPKGGSNLWKLKNQALEAGVLYNLTKGIPDPYLKQNMQKVV